MSEINLSKKSKGFIGLIPTLSRTAAAGGSAEIHIDPIEEDFGLEMYEAKIISMGQPIVAPYQGPLVACSRWAARLLGAQVNFEDCSA